ncbi:MAG TPA: siderophore-interacting protein [Methyloradius sp.]
MQDTNFSKAELMVSRVRHPLKLRVLQVKQVKAISTRLVRITLSGEDLHDFESASFDDHIKVFFPKPGEEKPQLPQLGSDGPIFVPDAERPTARDFTPRRFNREARELDIEFALHEEGPATGWAAQAKAGQYLGIGGPRGSMIIPTGFDWHLLIGDETALPAIARRLEELPEGTRVAVIIEVETPSAQIDLPTAAEAHIQWVYRQTLGQPGIDHLGVGLMKTLTQLYIPAGEGYVWAAGEASVIRAVRQYLVEERSIDKSRIRAASYWKRGAQAVHEKIED